MTFDDESFDAINMKSEELKKLTRMMCGDVFELLGENKR